LRLIPCGCLYFVLVLTGLWGTDTEAQDNITAEDAQEVRTALADADMAQEVAVPWQSSSSINSTHDSWGGRWDARIIVSEKGQADCQTILNLKSSFFSARGRWRRSRDGASFQAFTGNLKWKGLKVLVGGLGMSTGYGLLLNSPGRSGGLSAGQAFASQVTRLKGWATAAEKRSALGLGVSWEGQGWALTGLHGRLTGNDEGPNLSSICVEKQQGVFRLGAAVVKMDHQQGLSFSGRWQQGKQRLGFEWVLWGNPDQEARQGVWLVTLKTPLIRGMTIEAQWAASNGSAGPFMGVRPAVLNSWGGAGWAVRMTGRLDKSWRIKVLLSESQGKDWEGAHQNHAKQFFDFMILGRPLAGCQLSARWHQRIRTWEAWSEIYPWLPPAVVKEDERLGLTVNLKFGSADRSWVYSLRSLSRQGATTNGRRSLVSVRHRRSLGRKFSLMISFQSAWGANVDLVTAINPISGVLLPRHWGKWSSEFLAGIDYTKFGVRLMAAFSRREPAIDSGRSPENALWAGARAIW